jgi:hypothetical protein
LSPHAFQIDFAGHNIRDATYRAMRGYVAFEYSGEVILVLEGERRYPNVLKGYSTLILISFFFASSDFGRVIFKTPFL